MSFFEGFDLQGVVEVRVRFYVVGPGPHAELIALGLEVEREGSPDPESVEVEFEDGYGPTLATVQALVSTLNRRVQRQRGEER